MVSILTFLLISIGGLVLLVILFAVIIMVTKLLFRPLLSISIFILQVVLGLILLPVYLPILLYLYFFNKEKFHSNVSDILNPPAKQDIKFK